MPPGLPLVLPLGAGGFPDGLFIWNLRRMDIDLDAVFALQLFERHVHVQLSHGAENHFVRLGIADEHEGRILLDQFMEAHAHLLDVFLGLGVQGERHEGAGQRRFGNVERRIMLAGQRVAGLRVLELGDGHDVPRHGLLDRGVFFSDAVEQASGLLLGAAGGVQEAGVRRQGPRVDSNVIQPAHEWIDERFEHVGGKRSRAVDRQRYGFLTVALESLYRTSMRRLHRRGQSRDNGVQQLRRADVLYAGAAQNREQLPARNACFQSLQDLGGR